MILLNFSHPLTDEQIAQIEALTGQTIGKVIPLPTQFDNGQPFLPQLEALAAQIPLTAEELQTQPILVNPPSLNFITALLLAEMHGRMGYFPPIVRLSPIPDSLPPRYEVAEVLNLQAVRDTARKTRHGNGR
jgi:hypothetical protein